MGRAAGVVTQSRVAEKLSGALVNKAENNSESDVVKEAAADELGRAVVLAIW
jgi:hypothetical protein